MHNDLPFILSSLEIIPSVALKRRVFGQATVYTIYRQPAGPLTGQSTPTGRNWLGPSPILSSGFEEAGSTGENHGNAAKRPAADGTQAGSSLLNLETGEVNRLNFLQKRSQPFKLIKLNE